MIVHGTGHPRVLLVDDSPNVTEVMGAHLEGAGYAVSVAGDVDAALAAARGAAPDVALLDCELPSGAGIEVLRALRDDPELRDTAVVIVTRAADLARAVEALELGADDFVHEPFEPVELLARVHVVLRRRRGGQRGQDATGAVPVVAGASLDRIAMREAVAAAAPGPPASVVGLRIERLRTINRTLGERAGDALLARAADALVRAAGPGVAVGRLSGSTLAAVVVQDPEAVVRAVPEHVTAAGAQAGLRAAWTPVDPAVPERSLVAIEDLLDR